MAVEMPEMTMAASSNNDFFLKLDGIQGETTDSDHPAEIEILGWSFGINDEDVDEQRGRRSSGGRDNLPVFRQGGDAASFGQSLAGSVRVGDLHLSKRVDAASAPLMHASTNRQRIAKAILTCRKASGAEGLEYLQIQLHDVMVMRWRVLAADDGSQLPGEELVLGYTRIEFTYQPQGRLGTAEGKKMAGWDRKLNASL